MTLIVRAVVLTALLMSAPAYGAEQLGRLFFTPAERAQLDSGKLQDIDSRGGRGVLTVNGIVQKRGGARTVWINGVPQEAGASDERSPDSVSVAIPGKQRVKVKVGQKVPIHPAAEPGK